MFFHVTGRDEFAEESMKKGAVRSVIVRSVTKYQSSFERREVSELLYRGPSFDWPG